MRIRRLVPFVVLLGFGCAGAGAGGNLNGDGGNTGTGGSAAGNDAGGSGGMASPGGTGGTESSKTGGAGVTGGTGGGGAATGGTGGTPPDPNNRDYGNQTAEFLGASRCETSGLLFCDDFEGNTIDLTRWSVARLVPNVVELSTDQAARGKKSLHLRAQNNMAYVSTRKPFPIANNTYWARMFVRVARFSTVSYAHWTMAEAAGKGDGSVIRVGGQYASNVSQNRWGVGSDRGPTGDWTTHDADPAGKPAQPAVNTWVCLEWLHDGANDVTKFFVDAIEHPSLGTTKDKHGGNKVPYVMPEFESVWFGWWQYQGDPMPFDVWIDEIAIDGMRIGCKL
jgi:hypothetical protein